MKATKPACILGAIAAWASIVFGAPDADVVEVMNLLRRTVPARGAIFVEYQVQDGVGTRRVAVDLESGAFIYDSGTIIVGRTAGGEGYRQPQDAAGHALQMLVPSEHFAEPSSVYTVANRLPFMRTREILAKGRPLKSLRALREGGFEFVVHYEHGTPSWSPGQAQASVQRGPQDVWIRVDSRGRVIFSGSDSDTGVRYEYAAEPATDGPDVPAWIWISADAPPRQLSRREWFAESAQVLDLFERDRAWAWVAEARGIDNALIEMSAAERTRAAQDPPSTDRADTGRASSPSAPLVAPKRDGFQSSVPATVADARDAPPSQGASAYHAAKWMVPAIVLAGAAGVGVAFGLRRHRTLALRRRLFSTKG